MLDHVFLETTTIERDQRVCYQDVTRRCFHVRLTHHVKYAEKLPLISLWGIPQHVQIIVYLVVNTHYFSINDPLRHLSLF